MGNTISVSVVNRNIRENAIDESTINFLNNEINKTILDFTLDNIKKCVRNVLSDKNIKISGIKVNGNFVNDIEKKQDLMSDFTCLRIEDAYRDVSTHLEIMLNELFAGKLTNENYSDLNIIVSAKTINEFKTMKNANLNPNTNINQIVDSVIVNDDAKNIKNVVKISVNGNFSLNMFEDCVNSTIAKQVTSLKNVKENDTIIISQDQTQLIRAFSECIKQKDIGNKIVQDIANLFELKINDDLLDDPKLNIDQTNATGNLSDSLKMDSIFNFFRNKNVVIVAIAGVSLLLFCLIMVIFVFILINKNSKQQTQYYGNMIGKK